MAPVNVLVLLILCALAGTVLGQWKSRWWHGMLAGLLLGPVGVAVMLLIPVSQDARVRREQRKLAARQEAQRRLDDSGPGC